MTTIITQVLITIEQPDGTMTQIGKQAKIDCGDNPKFFTEEATTAVMQTMVVALAGVEELTKEKKR